MAKRFGLCNLKETYKPLVIQSTTVNTIFHSIRIEFETANEFAVIYLENELKAGDVGEISIEYNAKILSWLDLNSAGFYWVNMPKIDQSDGKHRNDF